MYTPHFKKDKKNVPVLSWFEINIIAERYAVDFMPEIVTNPQPFDIDGFIERYLRLSIDYQYLSNDGRYLGMTVFNSTEKVVIYLPEAQCADYIHVDSGTIIIDSSLLTKKQEHRYRFTLGHEGGHWIFHRDYFGCNPDQLSMFDLKSPFIQCREVNRNYQRCSTDNWNEARWMEWQADKFSAGILMPTTAVRTLLDDSRGSINASQATKLLSKVFNVSEQAAYLRVCDLGYIRQTYNEIEYNQLQLDI